MKSPILLLLAATLVVNCASAQTALKLGSTFSYVNVDGSYSMNLGVDIPSVFFFRPKNRYLEVGLDELRFFHNKPLSAEAVKRVEANLSPFIEYGILTGNNESVFRFKAGGRATVNNFLGVYRSTVSSAFPDNYFSSTAALALSPGFLYAFSERWFLDGSISMDMFTFGRYSYKVDNPAIPIRQQKTNEWRHDFVPGVYNLRVAVIYKI